MVRVRMKDGNRTVELPATSSRPAPPPPHPLAGWSLRPGAPMMPLPAALVSFPNGPPRYGQFPVLPPLDVRQAMLAGGGGPPLSFGMPMFRIPPAPPQIFQPQSPPVQEIPAAPSKSAAGSRLFNSVKERLGPGSRTATPERTESTQSAQSDEVGETGEEQEVMRQWKQFVGEVAHTNDYEKVGNMTACSYEVVQFACEYAAHVREQCRLEFEAELERLKAEEAEHREKNLLTGLHLSNFSNLDLGPHAKSAFGAASLPKAGKNSATTGSSQSGGTEEFSDFLQGLQVNTPASSTDDAEFSIRIPDFGRESPGFNSTKQKKRTFKTDAPEFVPIARRSDSSVEQPTAEVKTPTVITPPASADSSATKTARPQASWAEGLSEQEFLEVSAYFSQMDVRDGPRA